MFACLVPTFFAFPLTNQMSKELFFFFFLVVSLCCWEWAWTFDPPVSISLMLACCLLYTCGELDVPECQTNVLPTEPYPQSPRKTFFVTNPPILTLTFHVKSHPHFWFQRFNNFFLRAHHCSLCWEQYRLTEGQFCLPSVTALSGGSSDCHSLLPASSG